MENVYKWAANLSEMYSLLEDEQSKRLFWAQLQYDCEPNMENAIKLFELGDIDAAESFHWWSQITERAKMLLQKGKKLFLYGASGVGQRIGEYLLKQGADFYAYCARNHEKYVNGVLGKAVYDPEYVFEHCQECYVLICSAESSEEIYDILMARHFPETQVMFWVRPVIHKTLTEHRYFELSESLFNGKAFIDAGCYDLETSICFADWCGKKYSKIIAFEPDPKNFQKCCDIAKGAGLRIELLSSGLSEKSGEKTFSARSASGSRIVGDEAMPADGKRRNTGSEVIQIKTAALDDVATETEVGFIKMDIEGAELDALYGAKNTIVRDKPLLAVCVYHKSGDILAIMDYLHCVLPEYRFKLRHYNGAGVVGSETVLYAFVPASQS